VHTRRVVLKLFGFYYKFGKNKIAIIQYAYNIYINLYTREMVSIVCGTITYNIISYLPRTERMFSKAH